MAEEDQKEICCQEAKIIAKFIKHHFQNVKDYRREKLVKHRLSDIFFITICAVTSGCNKLKSVAEYAKTKKDWFSSVLDLENGVPSYSTLWTVFCILDPEELCDAFVNWMKAMSFINIVSAWATQNGLTLAQLKVEGKSNEITAIPKLLKLIDIKNTVVTIDAMGSQKNIAKQIIRQEGDYILAVKKNQEQLHSELVNFFNQAKQYGDEGRNYKFFESEDNGHGRKEVRKIFATEDIDFLKNKLSWSGLRSIVCVQSERTVKGNTSEENRYYISSLAPDPKDLGEKIRSHWGIESAHWILDVAFREDEQNSKAGNIPENLSILRRIALNLLKQDKTTKAGIEIKRQKAGWDNEYLLRILSVKSF